MTRAVPRRARLVVRIYFGTLLAIFAIAALIGVGKFVVEPPWVGMADRQVLFHTRTLAELQGQPEALEAHAQRIRRELGVGLTVYRADGTLIVSNVSPPIPPLPPAALARLEHRPTLAVGARPTLAAGLRENGHVATYGLFTPLELTQPLGYLVLSIAIVLLCVAAVSALAARAVTRPLGRLAEAAHTLGSGDLGARVRLDRRDEFGEVGRAFDDMADRIGQLLRSEQALLANVSHELRTPLARIRVALDIADEGDAALARESLGEIAQDLAELERLVDDILATARFELAAGRADAAVPLVRLLTLDTRALVEKAAARFTAAHPSRPCEVVIPGELPPLDADAPLLRRVIENLLDNAHKFSEPTTPLVLRACHTDGHVVVEVVDLGIGISTEDLPHVFEPFFRADRSRSRATGGVGLGLALARRIVEAHGGAIAIESTVGVGTLVRVTIPQTTAAGSAAA